MTNHPLRPSQSLHRILGGTIRRHKFAFCASAPIADERRRKCALKNFHVALLTVAWASGALGAEVSVREVQLGTYEFIVTNPTPLSETEAMALVAKAAESVCEEATPRLGKYRYEASEVIGGGGSSAPEPKAFRFVQAVSCVRGATLEAGERLPMLEGAEEARKVQDEVKRKSEEYFRLIASRQVDEAITQVAVAGMGGNEADWKSEKLSFQGIAGEPVEISVRKITVYDNPADAPEPGLYVAADYSNEYRGVPIHCGYLMWYRPDGGEFRITREESGYVTADQLKSIPGVRLPEIRSRLRCVD